MEGVDNGDFQYPVEYLNSWISNFTSEAEYWYTIDDSENLDLTAGICNGTLYRDPHRINYGQYGSFFEALRYGYRMARSTRKSHIWHVILGDSLGQCWGMLNKWFISVV